MGHDSNLTQVVSIKIIPQFFYFSAILHLEDRNKKLMYNQEEDPGFNPTPIHILAWGGRQERAAKTSAVVPIGSEAEERELLAAQAAKLSEVRINIAFNLYKIKH